MKTRPYCQLSYGVVVIFVLALPLLASCRSALSQPASTVTIMTAAITPTNSIMPTLTEELLTLKSTSTPEKTETPKIVLPNPTKTPAPCPPFLLDLNLPHPDLPENYIGRHYDLYNLPQELMDSGGSLIRDRSGQFELGLQTVKWKEDRELYWLEKLVCNDADGHPYFEIVDAFATPSLSGDEIHIETCFDGDEELNVIGLGRYDKSDPLVTIGEFRGWQFTEILFLYRIDFEAQKFIFVDPNGLVCFKYQGS
jgi:hypothetical protein